MSVDIGFLELANGKCPYQEWEQTLDATTRGIVRIRINRLRLGNFGDCKSIQGAQGLHELRIHVGAGYRIYFGKSREVLVILLCGGSKGTQTRDIAKAKQYWQLYKAALKGNQND